MLGDDDTSDDLWHGNTDRHGTAEDLINSLTCFRRIQYIHLGMWCTQQIYVMCSGNKRNVCMRGANYWTYHYIGERG